MRSLLWVGDAGCQSGFGKATQYTLDTLRHTHKVSVLGLNFRGDATERLRREWPYDMYPCWPGGDLFGMRRLLHVMDQVHPNIVVFQNDPWNIPGYMREIEKLKHPPICVGAIAVDGLNCAGRALNQLDHCIFWMPFAQREAQLGGYTKSSGVVTLGVDRAVFQPGDMRTARMEIGLPDQMLDGFIVGNINRNQPRKRLDLTIRYFAKWLERYPHDDAYLYLHVAPTGDNCYDCDNLAAYYKLNGRVAVAAPDKFQGLPERMVCATMQAFDIGFSTTQGEGMGLPALEMMACRKALVLPLWSAYEDWVDPLAAMLVPCTSTIATPGANVIGGIMDEHLAIEALEYLYQNQGERKAIADHAYQLAAQPRFNWQVIGKQWQNELERACLTVSSCAA